MVVIEAHRGEDGVWEVQPRHLHASEDIVTLDDPSAYSVVEAAVRVGTDTRTLTVFIEDEEDGWVSVEAAFATQ